MKVSSFNKDEVFKTRQLASAARWLTLLALNCLSTSARAGSYSVSYSGGSVSTTNAGTTTNTACKIDTDGLYGDGNGAGWGTQTSPSRGGLGHFGKCEMRVRNHRDFHAAIKRGD